MISIDNDAISMVQSNKQSKKRRKQKMIKLETVGAVHTHTHTHTHTIESYKSNCHFTKLYSNRISFIQATLKRIKYKHKDRLWNTTMGCPFCVHQNCSHKVVMDSS